MRPGGVSVLRGGDPSARRALARRRRRRRIRIGVAWGTLVMVVVGVGLGIRTGGTAMLSWVRTNTGIFEVRQVDPGGTVWVPPWEVVDASLVNPGDDLLALSKDQVASRVTGHPRVASTEVRRTLRRKLELRVEEKPPVALWLGRSPLEVAADGTVLGPPPVGAGPEWPTNVHGGPRGVDLPLITGLALTALTPGDVISHEGARQALAFLARLRAYGDGGEFWISEIWVGRPGALVAVTLKGAIPVHLGDGRLSPKKLRALHAVLDRVDSEADQIQYVDARFRHQVIVKTG